MTTDFQYRCPLCGTHGRVWDKQDEVFQCRQCFSIYSKFGLVVESQQELHDFWS